MVLASSITVLTNPSPPPTQSRFLRRAGTPFHDSRIPRMRIRATRISCPGSLLETTCWGPHPSSMGRVYIGQCLASTDRPIDRLALIRLTLIILLKLAYLRISHTTCKYRLDGRRFDAVVTVVFPDKSWHPGSMYILGHILARRGHVYDKKAFGERR